MDKPFGVEELNIKGSGTATPVIQGSGNIAIKLGNSTSASTTKLYIGDSNDIATGEIANPDNTTVVNCGIVTANEYYGTFKGTVTTGDITADEGTFNGKLDLYSYLAFYNSGQFMGLQCNPSGQLEVLKNNVSTVALTIDDDNGNLDIGDGVTVDGNVNPKTDSQYDLGTNSVRWQNGYFDTLYGSGANLTGLTGASAATYGDASNVAQIVVNSDGKITGISNVSISGGLSEVTVTQYKNLAEDSRSCSSPIYVTDSYKIGIGSTSNAYGNRWQQSDDPTSTAGGSHTVCDGDIWYDTSAEGSASSSTFGNVTIGAGSDLNKILTINSKQLILESATGAVKVNGNLNANIAFDIDAETGTYTLVAADAGKFKTVTGDVTIPNGVFGSGDSITIYNNSDNQIDINQSSVTLRLAGSTITGSRSLVGRGLATVICVDDGATDEFVLVGAGLT